MSAEFNTTITLVGTQKEIIAMADILSFYFKEKKEQYAEKKNCAYLASINVPMPFTKDFVPTDSSTKYTVKVTAEGPYGIFQWLSLHCPGT